MSRLNGESFREFCLKLISGLQIKLSFSVFRKIGKTLEAAFKTLFNKANHHWFPRYGGRHLEGGHKNLQSYHPYLRNQRR